MRPRQRERGQSTVEFALLSLGFIVGLLLVIQLSLIAVAKHQLNHLAFQTARLWSIQESEDLGTAIKRAGAAYKKARGNAPMSRYLADNLTGKVDEPGGRVVFTAYIPLIIPGAAHAIANTANARGRGSPTGRDVQARLVVPMRREPKMNKTPEEHDAKLQNCGSGTALDSAPSCYDNER